MDLEKLIWGNGFMIKKKNIISSCSNDGSEFTRKQNKKNTSIFKHKQVRMNTGY